VANPKIIVAMPAYNEEKYIGSVILRSKQYADEIIVVDDGSTDHTAEVVKLAGAFVVKHMGNKGYGNTIQKILATAKKHEADILVILDADSQHNPDEIPTLVKAITEGFDVVIGSREMQKNTIAHYRRFGQRVLSRLTRIASQKKLSDTESGFRAYSKKAIDTLKLKEKGMAISSEIVSEASAKGLKITEVPISVTYTKDGSTMNPIKHGVGVLNRIMVMISEKRPLLFFGILGIASMILGVIAGIIVVLKFAGTGVIATGTLLATVLLVTFGTLNISTGIILNVLEKRIKERFK